MQVLCTEKDWSRTPLGPVEAWSQALRFAVRTSLVSAFPISLWCGEELTLIYNDAYRSILGAKHPEALGQPAYEVWKEIWSEIDPLLEEVQAKDTSVYREDQPFHIERGQGDVSVSTGEPNGWFTFSLGPVHDEDGSLVAVQNIVSETTDRVLAERRAKESRARAKRAESRLLEIFENAPSFLAVLVEPDYTFEYANEAYHDLVGKDQLVGRPVFEVLPEAREQGFDELLDEVVDSGEPFIGRNVPIKLQRVPEGEPEQRYLDFVYYPIREEQGITGVVSHGYDVTEHVHTREAAQRARAEAEEANEAKTEFLETMSHELRTPLNAILGYTELLVEEITGSLSEAQHTQLQRIRASTRHLHTLVGDVLDLARVEAGEVEVASRRADMAEAIEEALALVRPQAREQELKLKLGVACADDDAPDYIGDEDRVRQILVNLLSNAVDFTPSGGEISVTFGSAPAPEVIQRTEKEESTTMTFARVSDTGVGIAPDDMERIFEPFTQAEEIAGSTRSGAGLGLAISRQLADLMEGCITVESEPGEGSTFTLWLPR